MRATWMIARAQLRARRRAIVALGLLLAVMAGAATAAAVGARRTESAYPRFVERYRSFDVTVTTGGSPDTDRIAATIATFPRVQSVHRTSIFYGSVRTRTGKEASFPDVFFIGTQATRGQPPLKVVAGRIFDPGAEDEAVVNYAMAESLGLRPGEDVSIRLTTGASQDAPPTPDIDVRVVGVVATISAFESATGDGYPTTFFMTPAFTKRWGTYIDPGEDNIDVLLRRGEADAEAFGRDLKVAGLETEPLSLASSFTKGVQDLNRVPAIALWLLCAFIAITTLAVVTQLLTRENQLTGRDHPVLRSLGLSRGELLALAIMRAGVVAAIGAGGAVAVAILLSPLTPVGLARIAEPDPGFTIDPWMLAAAVGATLILVPLLSLVSSWRAARHAFATPAVAARGSSFADGLARIGFPSSAQSGVRLAIEPGRGERAVPIRTAALGMTIAIAALSAALGFALSLDKLTATPQLSGYAWDAGAIVNAFTPEQLAERLPRIERSVREAMPDATIWRGTVFRSAAVERLEIGAYVSDGPGPSIIGGRAPRTATEVALDPRSMRQLGKEIGDAVSVANLAEPGERETPRRMRIVGTFVVPRIAFQGFLPGQGVAFTPQAAELLRPGVLPADTVFVRFGPGTGFDRGLATLRTATASPDAFALVNRQQSATVGNVSRLSSLPLILAVIVGLLGAATLAHALTTTIRRRRHDLAILKTLGFVRRQVQGTVAWQCTTLILTALAIGVPLGIAGGRWGWRLFATQLQVVPLPVTSWLAAFGIVGGTIALGNLIALAPGRAAARTPAAVVLHVE